MIEMLYLEYVNDISRLPSEYIKYIEDGEDGRTVICDYIAGMTDNYAVAKAKELFLPKAWEG